MSTVSDLITLALKDAGIIGVGQTASAEDTNDAFTRLNYLLAGWQRKRWMIWHLVDVACPSTGATSYTVGAGQSFNVPRPDRLEGAYLRQIIAAAPNQIDYPLGLIEARETYSQIALKQMGAFPQYVFYDAAYPYGTLYPYPVPQANIYELHILLKEQLAAFTGLTETIQLPPEYLNAIHYNLVARLRSAYQMPADPVVTALALDGMNIIRGANTQIPQLQMPATIVSGGSSYNIYSDNN